MSIGHMKQSPFKFLDPYEKKDKDIFFGREKEIELLYETTFKTNLLLIYGQSGTGKTSLIQCGLANRFRESDWFDIYIRRGDNINVSLQREIANKAETPITQGATVVEGIQSLYLDYLKPVYLIFDQFEELFILGSDPERQEFFETIKQLLKTLSRDGRKGVSCKILFIMREEYIARLYDFEKVVPQLFNHRFRVEPMHLSEVEAVIGGSCGAFGIGFVEREKTVKGIVENNRDEQGIIRLPYLQVYLDRLHREAGKPTEGETGETGGILFTPDLVEGIGKISDVMAAFLDEQTEGVQKELEKKYRDVPDECVWQVLNCFVTVEGTSLPLEKEVLYERLQVKKDILKDCLSGLERSRILRLSENQKTYEIAHDALAIRIDDKRSVEEKTLLKVERLVKDRFVAYGDTAAFLAKGELNYIEPYEKKLKSRLAAEEIYFIAKSRKHASKRRRNIVIGTIGIIVVLLLFAVFAGWQWKVAEEQKSIAEKNEKEAIANKVRAEKKEVEAIASKKLAEKNEREAKASKKIAEEQKGIAEQKAKETVKAREAQELAEEQKEITEKKATEEIANKEHAEEQKGIAEKKEREANALRLAVIAGIVVKEDPTLALRIAEKALQLDKNQKVKETIYKIYQENSFYKIAARHEEAVYSAAFSPDGNTILTGSGDKTARLWDLKGNLVQEFKGHTHAVTSVAFSPDGKTILTGSWDYTARLWDLQGNTIQEFKGHTKGFSSVAFSPDGKTILTELFDNTTRLWDLQGNRVQEFKGHTDTVNSVAFSPDGKTILTGSGDNTARLWDMQGNTVWEFRGHVREVHSVAFSPDGKTILTGSCDKTARLWEVPVSLEEFLKKGHVEMLTEEQKQEYGIED